MWPGALFFTGLTNLYDASALRNEHWFVWNASAAAWLEAFAAGFKFQEPTYVPTWKVYMALGQRMLSQSDCNSSGIVQTDKQVEEMALGFRQQHCFWMPGPLDMCYLPLLSPGRAKGSQDGIVYLLKALLSKEDVKYDSNIWHEWLLIHWTCRMP